MPKPEQPVESEGASLEEAKSFLTGLADKVTGSDKGPTPTPQSSFPVALILAGIAVIGFAIMGFMLMRAKRKAAQLASELRRKEEEHTQAAEDEKLAASEEDRKAAQVRVETTRKVADELKVKIDSLSKENEVRRKAIAELANWDDLVVVDKR